MPWISRAIFVGFVAAVAAGCSGATVVIPAVSAQEAASAEPFAWEGKLTPGQQVEIIGRNGRITAGPSTDGNVEVRGVRHGYNADEIRIEVTEHAGGVTIETVYPERGWWSWWGGSRRIDFSVAVPDDVDFVARNRNGHVDANGLGGNVEVVTRNGGITVIADGSVDVQTRNGRVQVEAGGYARAHSRNGSVRATLRKADWTGDATFETRNGSLTLHVPETVNADVSMHTRRGSIHTDLAVDADIDERRHLAGRIGDGGRNLRLKTRNGSIRLLVGNDGTTGASG